jgi:hypothetical protein
MNPKVKGQRIGQIQEGAQSRRPRRIMGVSASSVKRAQQRLKQSPKKETKPAKTLTLSETVWRRYQQFINRFPPTKHREVKLQLVTQILGEYDHKAKNLVAPIAITYPDGTTANVREIIFGKK